ncbi:lysine N(6)-hydroxylase/L-ornithine N(5)-oxygenase family protein [Paraburkholderia pallida]|nr:SidA/IucD/PvdA family monooxygenase [Paraburkholderia pallida]
MIYDVIGIGFGPANIALAVALEESGFSGTRLFLERKQSAGWQENMLLPGSDIQNHPLRDLVTPANPRSRYSFTNFLHENNRLFEFLNLGITFPLRQEYAQYVRWVAQSFSKWVRYDTRVDSLSVDDESGSDGPVFSISTPSGVYKARSVVVAPGRSPNIPRPFQHLLGPRAFHLTEYNARIEALGPQLAEGGAIAVVGASQSGVEIVLDLARRFPRAEVHSIIRSYGFRLKDTSPFSDEIYFPEFVDYYFNASPSGKARLNAELRSTNYSSVDGDVLHQLYMARYQQRLDGRDRLYMHQNADITAVTPDDERLAIDVTNHISGHASKIEVEAVVLATGFKNFGRGGKEELVHPLLLQVAEHLAIDPALGVGVNRNYSAQLRDGARLPPLFLNGLCESSHGFGDAGSFSLLALRAREIATALREITQVQSPCELEHV